MEKCKVCGKLLPEYKENEKNIIHGVCILKRETIKNANLIMSRKMYNKASGYFACYINEIFCIVDTIESSPVSNDLDKVIKECTDLHQINDDTTIIYRDSVKVWSGIVLKNGVIVNIYDIDKLLISIMLNDINKAVKIKMEEDKKLNKYILKKTKNAIL